MYLDAQELRHRLCNGFISHDGYVDGVFTDIFVKHGYNIEDPTVQGVLECVIDIVDYTEKDTGIVVYPKDIKGWKLRDIRMSQNLSMKALGEISGMSPSAIGHIEAGMSKPRPDTLKRIADALCCSVDDLS